MAEWRDRLREAAPLSLALLALLVAVAVRAWHIADTPLWLDEAYSAYAADHGLGFLWHVVPQYETHPPFYYTLLHFWCDAFGRSLLTRRMLGMLCGIGAVAVMGGAALSLGRLAGLPLLGRRWLLAAVLGMAAVQSLMVDMAHQVRPYPVMALAYAAGVLALLRLCEEGVAARRWIVLLFVAQALMLWLHNLGPLYAVAMSLALAVIVLRRGLRPSDWAWLAGGQLLVALIYLPAFIILTHQAKTWVQSTWLSFEPATIVDEVSLLYLNWNRWSRLAGLAVALLGIVLLFRRKGGWRPTVALLLLAIVPVALSIALSVLVAPVFLDRTLSAVTIPSLLLVGHGLVRTRWVALPLFLVLAAPMMAADRQQAGRPLQNWYALTAWLTPRMAPGDVVWAYPNEGALPLVYALADRGRALPILSEPKPVPAFDSGGFFPSGSRGVVSLYPRQIEALAATPHAKAPPVIWLLRVNPDIYDAGDPMLHMLERDRTVIDHYADGDIDLTGFRRRDLPPVAAAQQAQP